MQVEIRTGFRRTARIIKDDRAFRRAANRMPKPVPWEWAERWGLRRCGNR